VASETTTCPPWPADMIRATRCRSIPTEFDPTGNGSPVWTPIRIRSSAQSGQWAAPSAWRKALGTRPFSSVKAKDAGAAVSAYAGGAKKSISSWLTRSASS
jgi:hypothetical protein